MSKMNLKAEAIAAYDAAKANEHGADWRNVAELLRAALGTTSTRKAASGIADYPVNCPAKRVLWPSPVIAVTYADGERVRMSFACLPGKPLNIGRGLRVAATAWEFRMRSRYRAGAGERIAEYIANKADGKECSPVTLPTVPEIVACHVEVSGETVATIDPAECNAARLNP